MSLEEMNWNGVGLLRDTWSNTLHVNCSIASSQHALFCLVVMPGSTKRAVILQLAVPVY